MEAGGASAPQWQAVRNGKWELLPLQAPLPSAEAASSAGAELL